MRVVTFLRGVNVGGNHTVPMAKLKRWLEGLGFTGVTTLLNSGNVVFDAGRKTPLQLEKELSKKLEAWLKFEATAMVRTAEDLEALIDLRPTLPPDVKAYVAFAHGKPAPVAVPLSHDRSGLLVDAIVGRDVLIRSLPVNGRYAYSMDFIEKSVGTQVTTRNWNTVVKVLAALRA